jgi:hypothetical protein
VARTPLLSFLFFLLLLLLLLLLFPSNDMRASDKERRLRSYIQFLQTVALHGHQVCHRTEQVTVTREGGFLSVEGVLELSRSRDTQTSPQRWAKTCSFFFFFFPFQFIVCSSKGIFVHLNGNAISCTAVAGFRNFYREKQSWKETD